MSKELIHIKNIFDPLLPYIHLKSYEPAGSGVTISVVIPPSLTLNLEMIQSFIDNPELRFGTMGQRELTGAVKDKSFAAYILDNYYKGSLGKIHYSFVKKASDDPKELFNL